MMEANDVLLWPMQWDCLRVFPKVEELRSKIEEFHLAAAEPDTAQQRRRRHQVTRRCFRTVVECNLLNFDPCLDADSDPIVAWPVSGPKPTIFSNWDTGLFLAGFRLSQGDAGFSDDSAASFDYLAVDP